MPPRRPRRRRFEANPAGNVLVAIPLLIGVAFAISAAVELEPFGWPRQNEALAGAALLAVVAFYLGEQRALARAKMWRRTKLPVFLRWRLGERRGATTCGYCHDDLGADPAECLGCGATYHPGCRTELGGCATLGCAERAKALGGEAPRLKQ